MVPIHLNMSFNMNTIKVYKHTDYYIIVSIDEKNSEISKSKKISDIVDYILELTKGYPEVELKFWHLKGYLNKKKLNKLHELVKNTTIVDRRTLISYILLL